MSNTTITDFIGIGLIVVIFALWSYRYLIRPSIERKKIREKYYDPHTQKCHRLFDTLYQSVSGYRITNSIRKNLKTNDPALTYGEIDFLSFSVILKFINPEPGGVFYDLGCGAGKAVFASALLHDLSLACGVELLTPMYNLCVQQQNKFNTLVNQSPYFKERTFNIEFINADMLTVNIQNASIVFINATAFFGDLWNAIHHLLITVPTGCYIIISSKRLDPNYFNLLDDRRRLMSWGLNSVRIYQRT